MRISANFKLIILSCGLLIVVAAQWRCASTKSHEYQRLIAVGEDAQARLKETVQVVAQSESEVRSLRAEITAQQADVQNLQKQLEQSQRETKVAQTAVEQAKASARQGDFPPSPAVLSQWSGRQAGIQHARPGMLANLSQLTELPRRAGGDYMYSATFASKLDGVELGSRITSDQIEAGQDWLPGNPLPLSLMDAERKARDELNRFVTDQDQWEVTEIDLHRIPLTNSGSAKWYYAVRFETRNPNRIPLDSFAVTVSMSGAIGTTGLYRHP